MDPLRTGLRPLISLLGVAVLAPLAMTLSGCTRENRAATGPEATMVELNRAVAAMTMMNGRCPTDLNALTNFPYLRGKTLPPPPAGKKLVIDPTARQVVLADQ